MAKIIEHTHESVCPYWLAGALDLGCGPGYFTLGLARLVGPQGRVSTVDL